VSNALRTNSAGYNAKILAVSMNTVPIINNFRYFQRNLLRY